ncbi:MAG: DNA-3-methyladenine glycosylase I [Bacteroidales bacterium]|nr:DNA-3-methyladenine glycosylase I [Bacteroidales bacterium]
MMDKNKRCPWCGDDPLYVAYHDNEWGRLEPDNERRLFEFLVLEGAQAGLSWITILRKREGYRDAFLGFNIEQVAAMTEEDVERLMQHPGIVRNRLKIRSAINNAQRFLEVQREFGSFHNYVLTFLPEGKHIDRQPQTFADVPATSPESDVMSRDTGRRGFKFCGSVIIYSFLQAMGYINDHIAECFCRNINNSITGE